jgi:ferredoxin
VCVDTAPENFKMNDDDSNAFVYKQPENDEETEACEEALESCPVDAIGNDG